MSLIKRRFPILFVAVYFIVGISVIIFSSYPILFSRASQVADWTNTGAATATWGPSNANGVILDLTTPAPKDDGALAHDGGGYVVAAGNTLTAFGANDKFADDDHDDAVDYADGALIVSSADTTITSGEVVTSGTAGLTAFDSAEDPGGLEIYLDHGGTDDSYADGEDIFVEVHVGTDGYLTGNAMQAFSANELSYYDDNSGTGGNYDDGEAIIQDNDSDGRPSNGDTVVTAGKAKVRVFTATDNVCFDGSTINDAEYDSGERIWWDVAGDCGSFTSGVDVILVGFAAPTNGQTEFGAEKEVAFLDENNDGAYTCSRSGTCEPLVYTSNTDYANGGNLVAGGTTFFFDSSTEATDGIATTGNGWDESGGVEDLNDFASASSVFGYIAAAASTPYSDGDDIFKLIHNGSAVTPFVDDTESRLFDANDKYSDADNSGTYTDGELIASSADVDLAGVEITTSGTIDITAFASPFKYYDGSSNASYTDGEDIVNDADGSGYLDADKLNSITISNTGTAADADITTLTVWEESGATLGFQSGEDSNIGSDSTGLIFGQALTVTGSVFTAGKRIMLQLLLPLRQRTGVLLLLN